MTNLRIEIERDIPIPPKRVLQKGIHTKLAQMEPGDSIFLRNDRYYNIAMCAARKLRINLDWKFTSRKWKSGWRLWRER